MEKPELRVNNLVGSLLKALPNNFFTVSEVGDTMKIYDVAGETHYFYIDDLEPIPLTEDWLIKFGFNNHETFWSKTWGTNGVVIITYSQVYKSFMYQLAQSVDKSISTVHQLQNLYYALTGEELTISEPTKQSEG